MMNQTLIYFHKIFEPILFFDVHGPNMKIGHFWSSNISETEEATPTKILVHMHISSIPTCMNFLN